MTATAERSWTTIDKTEWERGPWDSEPDKLQWIDETTGLDCLIVRNRLGSLCGYVGVPPGHPAHGKGLDDVRRADGEWIEVHGDLTFCGACREGAPEGTGVCHVPEPGRPADVWWLGFDCAHSWDIQPGMEARGRGQGWPSTRVGGETYKSLAFVRAECTHLAAQLAP